MSATVGNVREVLARARERLGTTGRRTILFLDEIHRFNKAQQDALLPAVEEGLVTLIGATTENPYFELNSALLSRMQVYELEPLSRGASSREVVRRGEAELGVDARRRGRGRSSRARAGGDARTALGILELAVQTAQRPACRSPRAARRGRRAEAAAPLRQGRRRALRLHLGLDQVDARRATCRRRSTTSR